MSDLRITASASLSALLFVVCNTGCGPGGKSYELREGHYLRTTREPVISSPAVFDTNGDGRKEIAVGSWDGYFYLLDTKLQLRPGWPKYSRRGFFSSPALADLDGDGDFEIVVGSEAGKLFAWHADGRDAQGFPVDLGYRVWATPTVLPGRRLAVGTLGAFFILEGNGRAAPGWPQPIQGWPDATAAWKDANLVVTTLTPGDPSRGWIYWWKEDGTLMPRFPLVLEKDSDSSPAFAELDADGRLWAVFGDDAGYLHAVNSEGSEHPGFPIRTVGERSDLPPLPHPPLGGNVHSIEASPAVADLNGDGFPEIVVGAWDGRMYVVERSGRTLPGWPVSVGDQIISSAAVVDVSGDGRLDIIVGSKDGQLYGWNAEGRPLSGFPYRLGSPVFSSPWVGDLEEDGMADIVVGANNGVHILKDVGPLGKASWPMFHQNHQRSGAIP